MVAVVFTLALVNVSSAQPEPPSVGVAYYPEVTGDQMDDDIALMREMGVNLVRFGEFAWSRMETKDVEFNFARVIRLVVGP